MFNKECDICKLSLCFWCGKEKNELLLATKQTREWCDNKSMGVVVNYNACDKCEEEHKLGLWIIEASDTPTSKGQPEIQKGVYPTGKNWVVKKGVFNIDSPIAFVTEKSARDMGLYEVSGIDNENEPE